MTRSEKFKAAYTEAKALLETKKAEASKYPKDKEYHLAAVSLTYDPDHNKPETKQDLYTVCYFREKIESIHARTFARRMVLNWECAILDAFKQHVTVLPNCPEHLKEIFADRIVYRKHLVSEQLRPKMVNDIVNLSW